MTQPDPRLERARKWAAAGALVGIGVGLVVTVAGLALRNPKVILAGCGTVLGSLVPVTVLDRCAPGLVPGPAQEV